MRFHHHPNNDIGRTSTDTVIAMLTIIILIILVISLSPNLAKKMSLVKQGSLERNVEYSTLLTP
jgi:hypothetical protein